MRRWSSTVSFVAAAVAAGGLAAAGCGSDSETADPPVPTTTVGGYGGTGGGVGGVIGGSGGSGGEACVPETELCDGFDNDCDGDIDEDCPCIQGETQSCYSGDPDLLGIGECAEGEQTCDEHGVWGPCEDEVVPTEESCDGLDNDCDEGVDEDLGSVTCGLGICQVTVVACEDGEPVACIPGDAQPPEDCDGFDDDCDGELDEGCSCIDDETASCYSDSPDTQGVGECHDGLMTCVGGQYGPCVGDQTPVGEICNGLDDDCDHEDDNGDPGGGSACDTGLDGVCGPGVEHCVNASVQCVQNVQASAEICNNQDDDCDGTDDNGDPGGGGICDTGLQGVCAAGTEHCVNGGIDCVQDIASSPEQCDGDDNDCDGPVDEGDPGGGGDCDTGLDGVCAAGIEHCQGGGIQCVQQVSSSPEVCDGFDNDCDGLVDEGDPGGGGVCDTGNPGICAPGVWHCVGGGLQCVQNEQSTDEECNGDDDDCDGLVDDGDPDSGGICDTGLQGVCAAGIEHCQNGGLQCVQQVASSPEVCNGDDDDCDGPVDEGDPGGDMWCDTGLDGVCQDGTTHCQGGDIQCIQDVASGPEVCNGDDDDCDGFPDDGNPGGGQLCDTGLDGVCADGETNCVNGGLDCDQVVFAGAEVCDGLLDENCDGTVDEGCECDPLDPVTICGAGFNCVPQQSGPPVCELAGVGTAYHSCGADCAETYECINVGDLNPVCLQWCRVGGSDCGGSESCVGLAPEVYIGAQEWGVCFAAGVPPTWQCDAAWYTDGDCDCGCDAMDRVDCANATVGVCAYCDLIGSCSASTCPGDIHPTNNAGCN